AVDLSKVDGASLVSDLVGEPGVASVVGPIPNTAGDAAVVVVEPTTAPADEATTALLSRIRAEVPDGVRVTGLVAVFADISERLAARIWIVIGFVVLVSILLLTVLLRAPVVAMKAGLMNLLSVAAAYGVVTVVFQTDAGAHLVGLPHAAPVSSWVPILMF